MLVLDHKMGRTRLGLYVSVPGQRQPPFGILGAPTLVACASDTISFPGIEHEHEKFVHQTWYCEIRASG